MITYEFPSPYGGKLVRYNCAAYLLAMWFPSPYGGKLVPIKSLTRIGHVCFRPLTGVNWFEVRYASPIFVDVSIPLRG